MSHTIASQKLISMGITPLIENRARSEEDTEENLSDECKKLLVSLPREKGWRTPFLYQYQDFWCQPDEIQAIVSFQNHFQAKDDDIVIATIPKSGTTWLKGLAFATLNRESFKVTSKDHPLLHVNPHDLVPFFEYKLYADNQIPDLSDVCEPRLFGTHIPFSSLPNSIKKSDCKIVCICRNPFDTFISSWHFSNKLIPSSSTPLSLEETFEMYCKGVVGFGPFWTHMLGYWKESIERPQKVLFLKYEDMKADPHFQLRRLANFMDCPFSMEEERQGVIDKILTLCSIDSMKELKANRSGKSIKNFENKHLFRKGEVGDWINYFSPSMVERLSKVMEEHLAGSGLSFGFT